MKPARQDMLTLQLIPADGGAPTVEDVMEMFGREGYGFVATAVQQNVLLMRWKTSAYDIEAQLKTNSGNTKLVDSIYLFVSVDQSDLDAAAEVLNRVKCKLSRDYNLSIHGDEPPYRCESCSNPNGCDFCRRLIARLQKRHSATEASRQALAWVNAYPQRRNEFIAAIPEIEG